MTETTFLSFLAPPFPYFIEGNLTTYKRGQRHPDRYNLGFFDVIIMKEGSLYIGEEHEQWKLLSHDVLVLEPNKHHFPVEPCTEDTEFYWFHFQTKDKWCVQKEQKPLEPDQPVPTLHFHSENNTVHLPKHQKLGNPNELFNRLDILLKSTVKIRSLAFWETQQIFMQVLQSLENDQQNQSSHVKLAEQIEIYLKQHYKEPITNKSLAAQFHVHENYLARCMKAAFHCTPLEYLSNYRIEQARLHLLKTDLPLHLISEEIGFTRLSYFSQCFKNKYGVSPANYRKQYRRERSGAGTEGQVP
ncbi:helix-turn-helix transcriptional regulator [Metabacillus halosaccharovorans]|uniref:helix-turn-helix transcriptional regulator n=1 Tax=Metabacillus halosaccharovorans TaxID=930124 RepID=UPI00203A48BF|nr:AraC family transcriptional regulator [Metabacillus halosaccharovorans]MCM3442869.1 AraC family transcriptional regulator [Metabacillus halosaccharovorans]